MLRQTTSYVSPLADLSFTATLIAFRQKLEQDSGEPVATQDLNVGLLLYDLCQFIGLTSSQSNDVLGRSAADIGAATDN